MGKCFNTEGVCISDLHYMVDINRQLNEIKNLVDNGKYLTINRARQYGKTTTIRQLAQMLSPEYIVFSISFEGLDDYIYKNGSNFCQEFSGLLCDTIDYGETTGIPDEIHQILSSYACIIIGILQPARYKGKNKIMKAITLHRVPPMRTKGRYFCLG